MQDARKPFWMGGELVTEAEYLDRVRLTCARIDGLYLTKVWIADRIGMSRPHVNRVLNGKLRSVEVILKVEELLDKVERGEEGM